MKNIICALAYHLSLYVTYVYIIANREQNCNRIA